MPGSFEKFRRTALTMTPQPPKAHTAQNQKPSATMQSVSDDCIPTGLQCCCGKINEQGEYSHRRALRRMDDFAIQNEPPIKPHAT
jgi:hypothetical protein